MDVCMWRSRVAFLGGCERKGRGESDHERKLGIVTLGGVVLLDLPRDMLVDPKWEKLILDFNLHACVYCTATALPVCCRAAPCGGRFVSKVRRHKLLAISRRTRNQKARGILGTATNTLAPRRHLSAPCVVQAVQRCRAKCEDIVWNSDRVVVLFLCKMCYYLLLMG